MPMDLHRSRHFSSSDHRSVLIQLSALCFNSWFQEVAIMGLIEELSLEMRAVSSNNKNHQTKNNKMKEVRMLHRAGKQVR